MGVLKKIMIIDDDPDDQVFFRDALQTIQPDINCEMTSSCKEAFRQLETPPLPDFIFMDLNMPVMNGFDCLAYLKNQNNYKDIPIIIFTTSKNPNDINRTKQLGARWFMTKPDDFNILCNKLNKVIQMDFTDGIYSI